MTVDREPWKQELLGHEELFAKLYDRFVLVVAIVAIIPFIILAFFTLVIGYPLHLIKEFVFPQEAK